MNIVVDQARMEFQAVSTAIGHQSNKIKKAVDESTAELPETMADARAIAAELREMAEMMPPRMAVATSLACNCAVWKSEKIINLETILKTPNPLNICNGFLYS